MLGELANELTVSHHRELLRLPSNPTRRRLATQAVERAWTVRRLRAEVSSHQIPDGAPRGRPPLPAAVRRVRALGRLAEDLPPVEGLRPDQRAEMRETLDAQIDTLTRLRDSLEDPCPEPN